VAQVLGLRVFEPGIVMEGGAVDFNGAGTVLTTTSCLLNTNRNPQLSKREIERYLCDYYGQQHVVWLGEGIEGDDTDGHVDDLARFVDRETIVIGLEDDPRDPNYAVLRDARRRLDRARDQGGRPFTIAEPTAFARYRVTITATAGSGATAFPGATRQPWSSTSSDTGAS